MSRDSLRFLIDGCRGLFLFCIERVGANEALVQVDIRRVERDGRGFFEDVQADGRMMS